MDWLALAVQIDSFGLFGWKCRVAIQERYEYKGASQVVEALNSFGDIAALDEIYDKLRVATYWAGQTVLDAARFARRNWTLFVGIEPHIDRYANEYRSVVYFGPNGEELVHNVVGLSARGALCLEVIVFFTVRCVHAWGPSVTIEDEWR